MNVNRQKRQPVSLGVSSKGFTLIELIIVMAIFMVVIIISSQAFNKILSISSQQTKSSESDTQGIIGLEMLRVDLEHAGYGLPWVLNFPAAFDESTTDLALGIDTQLFNDINNTASSVDPNRVPRALQSAASFVDSRDYLVIKSLLADQEATTTKWAYIEDIGASSRIKTWDSNNFLAGERVITLDSRTRRLIASPPTNTVSYESDESADFYYEITAANMMPPAAAFQPQQESDVFLVYGVSDQDLRAPYNRVDYYVRRPSSAADIPTRCAPGTGILYKAIMSHGGDFERLPLVECIADMQVVFNVAADGINGVDVNESGLAGLSAREIRQQLKMVKIYIVAHEGGKDRGFNYANQTITVGEGSGRALDLKNDIVGSDDYKHYRWKTYKLVVIPKNINF